MVTLRDDYLARTFKHVTNQLIKYDTPEHKGSKSDSRDQRITLAVSRAVIDFMVAGLGHVLRGQPTREVSPPRQGDRDYIGRIDEYEFDRSMRLGMAKRMMHQSMFSPLQPTLEIHHWLSICLIRGMWT